MLNIGDQQTLTAALNGAPDANATWSVDNPAVLNISTAGPSATCVVTGIAAGGANVTITDGACTNKVAFSVSNVSHVCDRFTAGLSGVS